MNSKKILFCIILLVGCSAQVASDIYSPSLPAIAADLHTSLADVQLSMAIYMMGLAISQLIYGPLSEGLGRKIPLIAGLTIFLVGNLVSLLAPTITILMSGRLIQGCGAGACSTCWRAIFRDTFEGAELAKYGSYFSIIVTLIVPATPALGGYLQACFHWRANSALLMIYSLTTTLMVLIGFKETNQYRHREKLKLIFIFKTFSHILTSRVFIGYTLCTFMCYGAFFSWFSVGPVLLIHLAGMTPMEFGWVTLFGGGLATILGGWVNGKLVTKLGIYTMLRAGFVIMLIAGILMLFFKEIFDVNITAIVTPMIIFYFGVSFIWPNAFAGAFGPFGKMAGYAGALYGFMQISGAAAIGTIVSYLPHHNQLPLALVFIGGAGLAWLIFEAIIN